MQKGRHLKKLGRKVFCHWRCLYLPLLPNSLEKPPVQCRHLKPFFLWTHSEKRLLHLRRCLVGDRAAVEAKHLWVWPKATQSSKDHSTVVGSLVELYCCALKKNNAPNRPPSASNWNAGLIGRDHVPEAHEVFNELSDKVLPPTLSFPSNLAAKQKVEGLGLTVIHLVRLICSRAGPSWTIKKKKLLHLILMKASSPPWVSRISSQCCWLSLT